MSPGNGERRPLQEAPSEGSSRRQAAAPVAESTASGSTVDYMSHALAYARTGLDVLPLTPGGKTPLGRLVAHGKDDATHDAEQVRDWWAQCPDANIGLRPAEGVVVVDVDPRAGGATALVELTRPYGGLSPTWTAHTGGGGLHAWYRATGPLRARLCAGVDLKHRTGYVVAPPSLHPSGKRYGWGNTTLIAPAPPWLVALMAAPPPRPLPRVSGSLLSGAVVVESIFARPGLGRSLLAAVTTHDIPLVTGVALLSAVAYVVIMALSDVAERLVDPRIRPS